MFDGMRVHAGSEILVYVEKGKIRTIECCLQERRIEKHRCPVEKQDKQRREIGGKEYTLLPGLIDCHAHIALNGRTSRTAAKLGDQPWALWRRMEGDLIRILVHGVVAVRDAGDKRCLALHCRNKILDGDLPGPLIFAAGMALRKRGKYYGGFLGTGITSGEIRTALLKMLNLGVDQIKVIVSGVVSLREYGFVGEIQFSEEELKEIVKVANAYGLKVMAHANSDQAVQLCIRAGVHTVEHGYFLSKDSLLAMADHGIAWIPTLAPLAAQLSGELRKRHSPDALSVIEKTLKRQMEMVALAVNLGVKVGAGSDAGAPGVLHGLGLLQELELYQEAGLSGEEILRTATGTAGFILGKQNTLGVIQPGNPAHLILVKGDPLVDIRETGEVAYVIMPKCQPEEMYNMGRS